MFEIKGLKYRHILDIGHLVLDHPVSCIVGASGSGKTTLLRHLNRLCVPDEGEIWYDGQALSALNPVELRRRVVMLGQTPVLSGGTVGDELQLGLRCSQRLPASRQSLERVLEQVGLPKRPEDWCDKLSGGERQRLCLGRVLLMDAETYLLDEPSAALDRETEGFLLDCLTAFVRERERSLVIVTHSEQVSGRFPGSVVRMDRGRAGGYAA